MNARGTPLTAADLIRNFVFQRLAAEGADTRAHLADWPFETEFWENVEQVDLDNGQKVADLLPLIRRQAERYEAWTVAADDGDRQLNRVELAVYRMKPSESELQMDRSRRPAGPRKREWRLCSAMRCNFDTTCRCTAAEHSPCRRSCAMRCNFDTRPRVALPRAPASVVRQRQDARNARNASILFDGAPALALIQDASVPSQSIRSLLRCQLILDPSKWLIGEPASNGRDSDRTLLHRVIRGRTPLAADRVHARRDVQQHGAHRGPSRAIAQRAAAADDRGEPRGTALRRGRASR